MTRPPAKLIAMLCLLAFGLGQSVFASLGVRCTDSAGNVRIELGCVKTVQGACVTACDESQAEDEAEKSRHSDPAAPTPCEDEPLGSQASTGRLTPSSLSLEAVFAAVVVTLVWDHRLLASDQLGSIHRPERDRDRPPDALGRLRSVILIV